MAKHTNKRARQFGTIEAGVEYVVRPTANAVIFNDEGRVAVLRTPDGLFLPGGGRESNDATLIATLEREILEECGKQIQVGSEIGIADEYLYAKREMTHFCKQIVFYIGSFLESPEVASEDDHELIWMTSIKAAEQLHHKSHRWAVMAAQNNRHD